MVLHHLLLVDVEDGVVLQPNQNRIRPLFVGLLAALDPSGRDGPEH
jgi:hypothetical protein